MFYTSININNNNCVQTVSVYMNLYTYMLCVRNKFESNYNEKPINLHP